jgi:ABC-type enterochelin transport system permease subunit
MVKDEIKPTRRIAMRATIKRIATAVVATMAVATPAFAAYTDNRGFLVWSILGLSVLIIAVIPDEGNARHDGITK